MRHLEALAAAARAAQEAREASLPLEQLRELARKVPSARCAVEVLRSPDRAVSVIAEVKRTTATFADLTGVGDCGVMASFYEAGGAVAVSVVTESSLYHGDLADLDAVRAAVDVPVLMNDMVVTPYQVHEARAHGADMLVLIAGAVPDVVLAGLIDRTHSLGMTAVAEVHTRREALTAVESGAEVIMVDARDPQTCDVDRTLFEQVAEVLPAEVIRLAAGGVSGPHDVMNYARSGADVVLVGEAILRSADPQQFVAELVAAGAHPALLSATNREAH
ncbi:Indole-3-glycerol phosphate synthase [Actinomyces bovis]|uniref:indole-3-glycerol-phosphate synthase n=1 Tax=Actinomyces bovis TaxID=1658 RepID=A0ABY1VLN3_9ACTO|nr:indole-3-glycerol phosphate synthase TrpC [Actinomyces bovis]SPT52392.1 Indole-3-glycerol phosphate synthase [Actinomyces bovis]VEG53991.1 Indole-3-glycerol phosphate synthase [Actinomyces israelii]